MNVNKLFGKMIAAPPGWSTFREKIFIWANSVIIHSLKHPWAGEDLSLKIDERDQTIWICMLEL